MPRLKKKSIDNKGYITPPIPPVDDFVYFCVPCPNEPQHIENLLGAIQTLTLWSNYKRTDDKRGKQIADIWRDIWLNLTYVNDPCFHELDECGFYPNSSPRIVWFPENPWHPDEEIPDGYTYHPFTVVTNSVIDTIISEWGLGFKVGDVYTDLTKLPIATWLPDFIANLGNLPSFKIEDLNGTGIVKIHFLNIPQGGRALIQIDDVFNPLKLELVELEKDITSFPQETQEDIVIEVPITTDGMHSIKVTFLPTVNDSLIPVFFGGGLRSIEICGFGETNMTDPCCPDTNDKIDKSNLLLEQIIKLISGGFMLVPVQGSSNPPDLGGGDCAPAFFDHNTDETDVLVLMQRQKALCITVDRYVKSILLTALVDMGAPQFIVDWLASAIGATIPLELSHLFVSYPSVFEGLAAFIAAVTGGADITLIACQMFNNLIGDKNNTLSAFRDSVQPELLESLVLPLAGIVASSNAIEKNYIAFNKALEAAYTEDLSGYTCSCIPVGTCDPADFDIIAVNDCTVERVDDTHWHITQLNYTPYLSDKRQFHMTIRDNLYRCFYVNSQTQAVAGYDVYQCDGTHVTGIGGGGGGVIQFDETVLEYLTDPVVGIDTILEIICVP